MTPEQTAAFIHSQTVAALIEMESMKVANRIREEQGHTIAYGEEAFLALQDRYGIGHNAVLITFMEAC